MRGMKLLLQAFTYVHALTAVLFAAAALVLIGTSVQVAWTSLANGLGLGSAQAIIEAMGLLAAAVVALQIAQTVLEEEVLRDATIGAPTRVRRFLSRFFVVLVVALAIEGLVATFKAVHEDLAHLVYAAALLGGSALLLAAWGLFVRLNRYAEELEPEAIREATREDAKLQ